MSIRVSQVVKEIAATVASGNMRVTQAAAEILQSGGSPKARVTQANAEILAYAHSQLVYGVSPVSESNVPQPLVFHAFVVLGMTSVDESAVGAPSVTHNPQMVTYYYPSSGGGAYSTIAPPGSGEARYPVKASKEIVYAPRFSNWDSRLRYMQKLWEDYARAAVEGQPSAGVRGLGSLGRISNGFRWLEFGRQRRPWMRQGSIVTPAPSDGDTVVCEFEVPEGYYGWLSGFWWAYTGTGYVQGSTDICWRIRIGDQYPDGYGAVWFQLGTPTDPITVTGMLPLRSRQKAQLIVLVRNDSGSIQVGSSRIIGGMQGWLYEPEGGKGGGVRW